MFCTNCGIEIRSTDRFCCQCGKVTGLGAKPESPYTHRRLTLAPEGKKLLGVCTGFARYFEVDVTLVRIVWLVGAFMTGIGFLAYPIAWLLMPKESPAATAPVEVVHQAG